MTKGGPGARIAAATPMKPTHLPLALVLALTPVAGAEPPASLAVQSSVWHDYQKQSFTFNQHPAHVVEPKVAAPGRPWIWRTSFPDFHAEVDLELLRHGCHVAYLDVVDMLGCDAALDVMDEFYAAVRAQWKLAERPALEGVSRGGLSAYRYAARHPERIACIYADTPVMDLKSWPLKWPGAKPQVADALKYYQFGTEQDLLAYRGNPVDLLAPIAKAGIPLRHVVSLDDKVVPPEQNTLEAARRLRALGHELEVVTVAKGDPAADGHHFPLPEVFQSSRFILRQLCVPTGPTEYFQLRDGLANSLGKFAAGKTGRVAFVGGSITFNPGWRDELIRYFQQRFPETQFDFISTGIPSVGSVGHAFRLEQDVLARGPVDLVFVEAAVNDHNYDHLPRPQAAALALRGMEGVVRHLRSANPQTEVVLLHFVDDQHLPLWKKGEVPYTIAEHERVAAHYGCPSLNLSREVAERIKAGQFTWAGDFRNLHPSPYGQQVYANSMTRMLDATTAGPATPHALPPVPLDPKSYMNGRYGKLEAAKLGTGFTLDPKWHPTNGQGTRDGFANCPALVAEKPGAELSYDFEGRACGLFLAAGKDTGVIEFSIDGKPFETLDTWSPWSSSLHLPWPVILSDSLAPGTHHLTLRTTAREPGRTALHVIHFLFN